MMNFISLETLTRMQNNLKAVYDNFTIPDKKRIFVGMHNIMGMEMGGKVAIAITGKPEEYKVVDDGYDPQHTIFVWLIVENGDYWFWSGYKDAKRLRHSWDISYEFRRVLVEKTGYAL